MIQNFILALILTIFAVVLNYMLGNLGNLWVFSISFFCASFLGFSIFELVKRRKRKS